jgi:serine/threonine protein kinase/tetratricopeptide (TPR) repeat protein
MIEPGDATTPKEPSEQLRRLWRQGQRPDVRHFLAGAGSLGLAQVVAVLRTDQEARWQAGERVPAEAYLAMHPALPGDLEKALELVYGEFLLREGLGQMPVLDEYLRRFPQYASRLKQQVQLHQALADDPWSDLTATRPEPEGTAEALSSPAALPAIAGYDLVRELGRGGMGVVYQAYDRKRGHMVALKTMQGVEPSALYRFKAEFRTLAGLTHHNLITLYELVAEGGLWFFTMELLEGVSFLDHVGPAVSPAGAPDPAGLTPARLGRLRDGLRQLATGVRALHQAGKLHRDIKPGNVLVTRQGRVVLLDFGLAADLDRRGQHLSLQPRLLGTVAYMAPEQAACRPVSPASDWYAFGSMLYEALTGRPPFCGDPFEILSQKQDLDPPDPASLVPGIPDDLRALCGDLLRRDSRQRPSGDDILLRLGAEPAGRTPAPPTGITATTEVPLIGRARHLEALEAAFHACRQGRAVRLYVHGRSGVGKTALAQRFLDGLTERGEAVVLPGRCHEQESVPYKALDSLVDSLSRYLESLPRLEAQALLPRDIGALARVFPVLHRLEPVASAPGRGGAVSDPQEIRRRGLTALRELLGRLADRRPVVLFIDDLQWGDLDSAALLLELLRPPDPPPLLFLGCYRREDVAGSPCLRALLEADEPGQNVERGELAVEPLAPPERRELALALLASRDPAAQARADAIAHESGGNPFFIHELVHYLGAGGTHAEGEPGGDITLHEVLWGRVLRLPEEARRLLEVVAVAGRPLRQEDACRAAGVAAEQSAALACLRAGRLLRGVGPAESLEIETYHDRVRETLVTRLAPPALREHHRRLALVLEASRRSDPEALAVHFREAGEPGRAGTYYALAAAQAAEALAFDRAAKLYRLALELQAPRGVEGCQLRTRLADALANAGRGAESAGEYLRAADAAGGADARELQRRAALQLLSSGHVDDGLATLRTVLGAVGMKMPATPRRALWSLAWQRLRLRWRGLGFRRRDLRQIDAGELRRLETCRSAAVGLSMVDPLPGAYFQTGYLLLALRTGEPQHVVQALAMEGAHAAVGGGFSRRRSNELLRTAETLAQQLGQPYPAAMVALSKGVADALAGRWQSARALCDQAEGIFRTHCTGVMWELSTAHRFALWPLMFLGEVAELGRRLPVLIKEAQERNDLYAVTNLSLVLRTFVRLADDEPERARRELRQVMDGWSQQGFHVQHMNRLFDEVQIGLYQGEGSASWDKLTGHWPTLARSHLLRVQQVRILFLHLRARAAMAAAPAAAEPAPLWHAAERDARLLRRERIAWAKALAQLVRAGVAMGWHDTDGARQLLKDAAGRLDAAGLRLHAAAARRRQGERVDGSQGQRLVEQADAWMKGQNVRRPDRVTALLAPGFPDPLS